MTMPQDTDLPQDAENPGEGFAAAFRRPSQVVLIVCQMLLGLALTIALIVKFYMLILSDQVCLPDAATLGNMIRCSNVAMMLGQFVLAVAGFRLAALLFDPGLRDLPHMLLLAVSGAFLLVLAGLPGQGADWRSALLLLALTVALGAVHIARFLTARDEKK